MSVSESKKSFTDIVKEHLEVISEKAGIDARLVIIGLGVCLGFVLIGYLDFYITTIVGIVYPAFWSVRAIESEETGDDKQWLTYWVVFSLFSIIDLFSGFILKFIPYYFFLKLLFLIWLFMPNLRGATFVYDKFLIKLFKKYEKQLEQVGEKIIGQAEQMKKEGTQMIKDNQGKIISAGMQAATTVTSIGEKKGQ